MNLIKNYNEENLFKTQFTGSGLVIMALLVLALLSLGERILYDLARSFAGTIGTFGYFNNPQVIVVHAMFIIAILVITVVVNYAFGRRKEKYAIALIPYFITSILLAIQLAIQLGVYFTNNHSNLQFYLVMTLLVLISSYGVFYIQERFKRPERQKNSEGLFIVGIIVFSLFALLILSFSPTNTDNSRIGTNTTTTSEGVPGFR